MLSLVITLLVIGIAMYLINTYVPMSDPIKKILNAVVIVCVIFWLISVFGLLNGFRDVPVPQVHR